MSSRYPRRIADTTTSSQRAQKRGRGTHSKPPWSRRDHFKLYVALGSAAVLAAAGGGVAVALATRHHPKVAAPPSVPSSTVTVPAPAGPPCPLTGAPSAGGVPQRPAIAVKIDNYPDARPQSGLDKADVVFEEPVEGLITRFVAVFQCQQAASIGPVRSAREVDVQILDQLSHPLFFHVGGIDPVLSMISAADDDNLDLGYHSSIVTHPAGRYAPYDTYMSTAGGWSLAPSNTAPPQPLFTYGANPPAGAPITSINIPFSPTNNGTWTWNAGLGQWQLSYGGAPAMLSDGTQIAATNLVVERVSVTYGPYVENAGGGLEVQSHLIGSGPLTVLRGGQAITGTWQRPSLSSQTTLTAADGTVIPLAPGNTWVEIVPTSVNVTTK